MGFSLCILFRFMKIRGIAIVEKMISINKQLTVAGEVRKLLRPVSRAFSMLLVMANGRILKPTFPGERRVPCLY